MFRFLANPDVRQSIRAHRTRLGSAALAVIGRCFMVLAGPWFLGKGINIVADGMGQLSVRREVIYLLLFALGTAACQFWMRWWWIGWSRVTEARMRDGVFSNLVHLSPSFFDRNRTGDLLSRLTSDVEATRMGYGPGTMHLVQPVIMTVGAVFMMAQSSGLLTCVAAVPLLLLFLVMRLLLPRIHARSLAVQEQQAALSTRAQETFSGSRVIKAFARESYEAERFGGVSLALQRDSVTLAKTRALFNCLIELFAGLILVVVLLVGGWLVLEERLTVGEFVAVNDYLRLLIWPMIAMGWTLSLFKRAEAAEERVSMVRGAEAEIRDGAGDFPKAAQGAISVRDLGVRYPDAKQPALEGISFELGAGQSLGIVGATGSGKTTLGRVLGRLVDPPPGTVFLDGCDVRDYTLEALRGRIATVPQETFLFSDTIRANLAFGVESASDAEIANAARIACLDEAIASFPDGLDTDVGERGVTLSGGQRQRTAIARALLRDAPVLILDDALSAIDTETERKILDNLQDVIRERTTLLISHRISTVMHADEILVLEEGRVVERGTHTQLMAKRGRYAHIHRLQQDEDELERL